MATSLNELATRTLVGQEALRVASGRRGAAKRILARKGLKSLEEAEDENWRLKKWRWFSFERKLWALRCNQAEGEKRRQLGKKGKLVLKWITLPKEKAEDRDGTSPL